MDRTQELITLRQLPVIEEQLRTIRAEVEARTQRALGMVCNDGTVKEVRQMRAELNAEFAALEERRKEIKAKILAPYEAFEAVYRDNISGIYKSADAELKRKISEVENALKSERESELRAFYDELAESLGIDYAPFERSGITVTLSASSKRLKESAEAYLNRIADEAYVIAGREDRDEVMVEYKRCLNLREAIEAAESRRAALEAEKQRSAKAEARMEQESEAAQKAAQAAQEAPIAPAEQVYTLRFVVRGTLPQLKRLKEFLINGGYEYE